MRRLLICVLLDSVKFWCCVGDVGLLFFFLVVVVVVVVVVVDVGRKYINVQVW